MIQGLFGDGSVYHMLRTGLSDDMATARGVAGRVANATNGNGAEATQGGFQAELNGAEAVDLETELVRLVDTTVRYDAETRLLREAYTRLRTAIGGRG